CAAIGVPMTAATAAMTSILFRMARLLCDFLQGFFGGNASRLLSASNPDPIHAARHRSRKIATRAAAIFGIFGQRWNSLKRQASPEAIGVSYRGTAPEDK